MSDLDIQQIKLEIKKWEYQFQTDHGHKPTHSDIKAIPEIHLKYKTYNQYKSRGGANSESASSKIATELNDSIKKSTKHSFSSSRSYRNDSTVQYIPRSTSKRSLEYEEGYKGNAAAHTNPSTPQKKNAEVLAAILAAKIGPTPKMNGRVLGIFDLGSPEIIRQSPFQMRKVDSTISIEESTIYATPSKRKSKLNPDNSISPSKMMSPSKLMPSHATTQPPDLVNTHLTTPIKSKPSSPMNIEETPSKTPTYLNHRIISTISDSPIAPRRLNRSLSSMMAELRDIKEEQEKSNFNPDEDGFDINDLSDFNDDELYNSDTNSINSFEDHDLPSHSSSQPNKYKKKTQKRTTKRVIMRPTFNANDPIDESSAVKRPKPLPKKQPENFQRLKLHNSGYKTNRSKLFLGRRSR